MKSAGGVRPAEILTLNMMVSCHSIRRWLRRSTGLTYGLLAVMGCPGIVEASLTFSNASAVTFLTGNTAVPYPSLVVVSNVPGLITKVTVNFTGLNHTYPSDVDALLVGPGGQKVMLLSDAGASFNLTNISLTFDDVAPTQLSYTNAILSGTFRPTDHEPGDFLANPAPPGPYGSALSVFSNTVPNGTWSLYIYDDFPAVDGGTLAAWSVTIHYVFEAANSPREDFWVPDGPVNAMALRGDTLYLGGQFRALRRNPQTTGVAVDFNTLTPDPIFPPVKGVVRAIVGDGEGGFYLGGAFTSVGGVARANLAYVDREGNVTGWNPGADGPVLGLALANGTLYVGGDFSTIANQVRPRLAAVNSITGLATAWIPKPDGPVTGLALAGRRLFVAGSFLTANEAPRRSLAAWSTVDGTLLPWNPDPQGGGVSALAVLGDVVFVGGEFTSIGGTNRFGLAAVRANSGLPLPWNPSGTNSANSITALAIKGTTLYVGGNFSNLGGHARRVLGALNVDTGLATDWNPNVSNVPPVQIRSIAVNGDTVFVAGTFTNINGAARNGFAALDSRTAAVRSQSFGLAFPGAVIGISHQTIYLGGAALDSSVLRQNLAAVDVRTGEPTAWNPGCDGPVSALLVISNRVFVGGSFTNVGGFFRTNLAAVDAVSGVIDFSWTPNPNGEVLALARSPTGASTVFAGGRFTSVSGQTRNRIAALDAAGAATAWNPGADAPVHALAGAADGSAVLYAGGSFTNIAGVVRSRLAALNEFSGAALAGNRDANGVVRALAASGGGAYVGGDFTSVGGQSHFAIAQVDQFGTVTNWNPSVFGSVSSLAIVGDEVVAGGTFTNVVESERKGLVALNRTSGTPTTWQPEVGIAVSSLLATGNAIFAGGRFLSVGDSYEPGLVAFAPVLAPVITNQPFHRRVFAGSSVNLHAGVIGTPPLSYQWRRDGSALFGETNGSLMHPNVQSNNVGNYTVEIANSFGSVHSEPASVTLLSLPIILNQPASQTVAAGGVVALAAAVSGNPPPQILWRRNGTLIGPRAGSSLILSNAQPADGGLYEALIMNPAGFVISTSAVVRVLPVSAFSLADNRNNAVLASGAIGVAVGNNFNATSEPDEPLHAGAPGGKSLWMSWLAPSNGLAQFNTLGSDFDTLLAVYTESNGMLTPIDGDDDGAGYQTSSTAFNAVAGQIYRIAMDGLIGCSGNLVLSWRLDPFLSIPFITQSPTNVVVPLGGLAVFTVSATDSPGHLPLSYQWFHRREAIAGATSATLMIPSAGAADLGEYTVFVQNNECQTVQSSWVFLELSSAPSVRRDVKPIGLTLRNVSTLNGQSLIRTRELTTEIDPGAAACEFVSASVGTPTADSVIVIPGPSIAATNSMRTASVPRAAAPTPVSLCGFGVWIEYVCAMHADIPGVLFVRTVGAPVILSGVERGNDGSAIPLTPRACAESSVLDTEALMEMHLRQNANYEYSIVTLSGSATPDAVIDEERIFCPHPGVAGFVLTQPTESFQPFTYANNGALLTAQVTNLSPLCGQSLQWLRDGVPLEGESTTSLLVLNGTAPAQYSLVVSNCAGAVTNLVATLVRLEIFKEVADGRLKLRSQPPTTATFRVETATNLTVTPLLWYPFFTNEAGHLLPVNLPTDNNSNMLFRAKPLPLD